MHNRTIEVHISSIIILHALNQSIMLILQHVICLQSKLETGTNKKNFRDVCYHVSSESVSVSEAEVSCGVSGGRLASFLTAAELPGPNVTIPSNGVWLGKNYNKMEKCYVF